MNPYLLSFFMCSLFLTGAYSQKATETSAFYSTSDDQAVYKHMPKELKNIQLLSHPISIISDDYNLGDWQESPSKIIYHEGYYYIWIIDIPLMERKKCEQRMGFSTTRYPKSKDLIPWLDQGLIPLGESGSIDDNDRLAPDVVKYKGKFYMFYEPFTFNREKYVQTRCGIACLVADKLEGPWEYATEEKLILKPSLDNPVAFDHSVVANPRIEFLNGTWFMYNKARKYSLENTPEDYKTENDIATADNLLGPYTKHKGNPISSGHSAYLLKYKSGLMMRWSTVYIPDNPLYGGDDSLPDANTYIGITSRWQMEYGYQKGNNGIIGFKVNFEGVTQAKTDDFNI